MDVHNPLKMVLIGIDPYPYGFVRFVLWGIPLKIVKTTNCWEPPHSGGNLPSWAKLCRFLNMSWWVMNTYGMAVDSDLGKLYMADFEKTGKFTGEKHWLHWPHPAGQLRWKRCRGAKKLKMLLNGYLLYISVHVQVQFCMILHVGVFACQCLSAYGILYIPCRWA